MKKQNIIWALIGSVMFLLMNTGFAHGSQINMKAIRQIESSDCVFKVGRYEDARGCYQLTKWVIRDWNHYHPYELYTMETAAEDAANEKIASWYLNKRIPAMIRAYGKPVTTDNILIAYNAGIKYVVNGEEIPKITKQYLIKYRKFTGGS